VIWGEKMKAHHEYNIEQVIYARKVLRDSMNLETQTFPLSAVIGMLSDEIDAMRKAGISDITISKLMGLGLGDAVSVRDIQKYFAPLT
jgi:hypothetical protein